MGSRVSKPRSVAFDSKVSESWVRVGVDVGGTFTDVVVADSTGAIFSWKLPSTPHDFSIAVLEGIREVFDRKQVASASVRDVVHGSTVATNVILERKGVRTGLLTTLGFRDVIELRRLRMPKLYQMDWKKPTPLVERYVRREVRERIDLLGSVVTPIDLAAARAAIKALVDDGVESLAVSFLHSYANPVHEQAIGALLASEFPELWVSLSHRILPVIREYERTSTTVINAYVQPIVAKYLQSLSSQLRETGVAAPLLIMQSNGGIMTAAAAAERPAYIVESGPAAGVIASASLAQSLGINEVITFDMGGTTAKASLVEGGRPHFTAEFEVAAGISASSRLSSGGGYALSVPFIDLAEVGAGGGSIIWIDSGGAPKVGPVSAGASPGPVCYGHGGTKPTVTDANLLLGYLNPDGLLDGAIPLDVDHARLVFERDVASRLGMDLLEAAFGSHEIANASMIRAIKSVSVERGRDPGEFTLIAFGGSGPIHAASIARELGVRRIIIPMRPGVFSAVGLLQARLECHSKRTHLNRTRDLDKRELARQLAALERDALEGLGASSLSHVSFEAEAWAEMRYVGQAFELPVRLPPRTGSWSDWLDLLESAFQAEHERTYGHRTDNPTEVVHLRVVAREVDPRPLAPSKASALKKRGPRSRDVHFGPAFGSLPTPIIRRDELSRRTVGGPLVVEDYDSTTLVPPFCRARRDSRGNIAIEVSRHD